MWDPAGCSLSGRALERAFDQRSDEGATVGGAGMDIVLRVDGGGGGSLDFGDGRRVDGSSVEDVFHGGQTQRPVRHADDADMGVARLAALVLVVEKRPRRHCAIAAAAGGIPKSPTPAPPPGRPAGQAGRRISTMISSGVSAVVSAPWKKSAAWITRAPDFPTTAISASQVNAIPGISAAGSACARLPPTVPRLRTW